MQFKALAPENKPAAGLWPIVKVSKVSVMTAIALVFMAFFGRSVECGAQVRKNVAAPGEKAGPVDLSRIRPDRYFTEAYQRYKEKDFDAAVELFKMAIVDNPDNFMAYFYLSSIYLEQKKFEEAESIMSVASHIKPNPSEAEKAFAEAGAVMSENEIIRYKQSARYNYKEALKLLTEGEWHEAVKLLQNACSMEPDNEVYAVKIGEVFYDMNNRSKARSYFQKALAINPDNTTALKKLARLHYDEREFARAAEYYERLYKLSGDKKYLSMIGECDAKAGKGLREDACVVLKRRGASVFVNMGYNHGLQMGDTITKRLLVYRSRKSSEIKDPRSAKVVGYERPVLVGELLVTRIENDLCEALVAGEMNGGIMIGDEVRWKE